MLAQVSWAAFEREKDGPARHEAGVPSDGSLPVNHLSSSHNLHGRQAFVSLHGSDQNKWLLVTRALFNRSPSRQQSHRWLALRTQGNSNLNTRR